MPEWFRFDTRVRVDWRKKLNPMWWVANDDDPVPPDWYTHGAIWWWLRNPFHNFMFYVVGVSDRNYWVIGRSPPTLSLRRDINLKGWHWAILFPAKWLPLPYVSYSGTRWYWYLGWQPVGKLGAKIGRST